MTSPNRVRTPSGANGVRTRAGGWFAAVVAGARSAGFALLMAGLVSLVPGVSPAYAGEDGLTWVVTEASGDVQYRMGGKAPTGWRALQVGAVLGAAAEIRTGSNSRALLTHRGTTLSVSPESGLKLPGADRPNGVYRVFQSLGTLLYRIKERAAGMAAFEVETPYLVAVVKGTVFTVNASADGAAVHLTEGVVDVQPTLGGTGVTLTPGHTARITAVPGADVIVKDHDAGKRSGVTPPKGKGKSKSNAATSVGANASQGANTDDGKGDDGKGVTIVKSAKSDAGRRVRHPRAVAIFARNNRGGLFAKGVNVENAFKKKRGRHGSSNHGGQVSAVARDLVKSGGADVSAAAEDGGLALRTDDDGGGLSGDDDAGLSSNSGDDGGGLSGGGDGGGSLGDDGGGLLSSNTGGLGGDDGGGLLSSNTGGLGGGDGGSLSSSGSGSGGSSSSGSGSSNSGSGSSN